MMTPWDIFGRHIKNIEVRDDECWVWTGRLYGTQKTPQLSDFKYVNGKKVHAKFGALRYGMRKAGVEYVGEQVLVCGNNMCVNPDHAADTYSVVGRMVFVKNNTSRDGDCEIWESDRSTGYSRISVKFNPEDRLTQMHVQKFVWIAEHVPEGWPWPTTGTYETTCRRRHCVSHKHIVRRTKEGDDYEFPG